MLSVLQYMNTEDEKGKFIMSIPPGPVHEANPGTASGDVGRSKEDSMHNHSFHCTLRVLR